MDDVSADWSTQGCSEMGAAQQLWQGWPVLDIAWLETGGGPVCEQVLAQLPGWFGMPEANDDYRQKADANPTAVAGDSGFLTLVRHSLHAAEIYVMGVVPLMHRSGVGRSLLGAAESRLRSEAVEFLQVKTLSASAGDEGYSRTLAFYQSMGFVVLEEMPMLWNDPTQPAVVMIKHL
jgi:GNAT superfamily N-acetyltransferase